MGYEENEEKREEGDLIAVVSNRFVYQSAGIYMPGENNASIEDEV